ncbi:MAG: prepilin peptidase [Selenomonadaceae bacterium]|nr:prepilin peptidase [Selenomonadaceae bacterium]
MFGEIFLCVTLSAVLTVVGSRWIDKLYRTSTELTFPEKISTRAKFRKLIMFVALTGLIFVAEPTLTPEKIFTVAAIFLLSLMTATDFEQYMLFDEMTLSLAIIGAIRVWQLNLNVFDCAAASLIGGGFFFLLMMTTGALGGGDVKLIAALGLWLGCEKLLNVVLIGSIAGGIVALLIILSKQKDRSDCFAYGPYFTLTAIYFL